MKSYLLSIGLLLFLIAPCVGQADFFNHLKKDYLQPWDVQFQTNPKSVETNVPIKLLDSILTFKLNDDYSDLSEKLINRYDEFGRLIHYAYYDYYDGDFAKQAHTIYDVNYEQNKRVTEKRIWDPEVEKFRRNTRTIEYFDGKSRVEELLLESWSLGHKAYIPSGKIIIDYTSDDEFVLEQYYWDLNWKLEKEESYFKVTNRIYERHFKVYVIGQFSHGKIVEEFTSQNLLKKTTRFLLDQDTDIWIMGGGTENFYNAQNQLILELKSISLPTTDRDSIAHTFLEATNSESIYTYRDSNYPSTYSLYSLLEKQFDTDGDIDRTSDFNFNLTEQIVREYYYSIKDVLSAPVNVIQNIDIKIVNPVIAGQLNFELDAPSTFEFDAELCNALGQPIYQKRQLLPGRYSIPMQQLPSGIYYLSIIEGENRNTFKIFL